MNGVGENAGIAGMITRLQLQENKINKNTHSAPVITEPRK